MILPYQYLTDKQFLKALDCESHKENFIKVTVLNFQTEQPITSIEGKCLSGSCTLSSKSGARRAANCTVAVPNKSLYVEEATYSHIMDIENLFSLNKKVKIEIGYKNTLQQYTEYPIIWFPMGVFLIKNMSASKDTSGVNLSLTLVDKSILLNGDRGGKMPSAVVLSEVDQIDFRGISHNIEKVLMADIIKNLLVEYAGENPERVLVLDIPNVIKKVVKWTGQQSLYLCEPEGKACFFTTDADLGEEYEAKSFGYGENIGYTVENFVYPGKLESQVGETISSILDKIVTVLGGNFEWFYDINGNFIFQEKKNYINNAFSPVSEADLVGMSINDYLSSTVNSNLQFTKYDFDSSNRHLITNISNAPQFQNLKNDFIVWGSNKTSTGVAKPIRYHLALANKPNVRTASAKYLKYIDYRGLNQLMPITGNSMVTEVNFKNDIKDKKIYYIYNEQVWHWDEDIETFRTWNDCSVINFTPTDWRSELYLQAIESTENTFISNYFAKELVGELPKYYVFKDDNSIEGGSYYSMSDLSQVEYWLDLIDSGIEGFDLASLTVENIGKRTEVVNNSNANCLFANEIPNYILVPADGSVTEDVLKAEQIEGVEVIQVSEEIFSKVIVGGGQNAAFDQIRDLLYKHTAFNENVSLSMTPIYHLEPNTLISIHDDDVNVKGNYLITSITLPLTSNGTSSISAVRCIERTF